MPLVWMLWLTCTRRCWACSVSKKKRKKSSPARVGSPPWKRKWMLPPSSVAAKAFSISSRAVSRVIRPMLLQLRLLDTSS